MRGTLRERDGELRALAAALSAAAAGEGRLVVIDGPAGVGKSRLIQVAREEAAARSVPVFTARAVELERGVPFGVARRLFGAALLRRSAAERTRLLSGPAAPAAPLIDGRGSPDDALTGATIDGLYWLAVDLAAAPTPGGAAASALTVVVDDAQWADRSSLRFLLHAVSALQEVALCVIVAVRTDDVDAAPDLLNRLRAHPGCVRLAPALLSEAAIGAVVRDAGFADPHPDFVRACARASGGNPFLLVELLGVLSADGVAPNAASGQRVSELLPQSVLHAVLVSLGRLPAAATDLAAAVAVLDQAPLPMAAALAGLDVASAEDAADLLMRAQLFAPGDPLCFAHPLLSAAVLSDLRPLARARTHRRAAELLAASGAGPGRVAGQLLHTPPRADPWVSAILHPAGRNALRAGEFGSAVQLLRRALAEPPPDDDRVATLIDLAHAEAAADSPQAAARLEEALSHLADRQERAHTYAELSRLRFFTGEVAGAADAAERGLAELDPADDTSRRLLSAYLTAATFDARLRPGRGDRLAPYVHRARSGDVPADPLICAHVGARMAISGEDAAAIRPVVERALSGHPLVDGSAHGVVLAFPLVSLIMLDDLDRAERALAAAAGSPAARSSLIAATVIEHWSAVVAYRRGDLLGARAHARRAIAACDGNDWRLYDAWINSNLARVLVESGDTDAAAAVLAGLEAVDPIGRCLVLEARAQLAAAQADPATAYALYTAAGATLDALGLLSSGFVSWRSPAALAAGRGEDAARLVSADLALARRAGTNRSLGIALRAAGLTARPGEAIAPLTESARLLGSSPGSLEYARSLVALGAAQRRAGTRTEARTALQQALDIATRAGAAPLVRQATDELHAAGGRPRRAYLTGLESLTATERRMAEQAAAGRTNAEIGRELYVTTKTVEWHLANVYRKLHLSGRRELATVLSAGAR